jgi:hypothetical protein
MLKHSLMLTDTAMVLLRQYVEAWHDYKVVNQLFEEAQRDPEHPYHNNFELIQTITARRTRMDHLSRELVQDLWYVWHYDDLVVIRYLDWHLTLDPDAMRLASEIYLPVPMPGVGQSLQDIITNMQVLQLGPRLMKAYQTHINLAAEDHP